MCRRTGDVVDAYDLASARSLRYEARPLVQPNGMSALAHGASSLARTYAHDETPTIPTLRAIERIDMHVI